MLNMFIFKAQIKQTTSSTYKWLKHVLRSLCPFSPILTQWISLIVMLSVCFFDLVDCLHGFVFAFVLCSLLMPTTWTLCTPKIHLARVWLFLTLLPSTEIVSKTKRNNNNRNEQSTKQKNKDSDTNSKSCIQFETKLEMWFFFFFLQLLVRLCWISIRRKIHGKKICIIIVYSWKHRSNNSANYNFIQSREMLEIGRFLSDLTGNLMFTEIRDGKVRFRSFKKQSIDNHVVI